MWIEHVLLETNKVVCRNGGRYLYQKKVKGLHYDSDTPNKLNMVSNTSYDDPQQLTSIYDICTNILSQLST